MTDKHQPSIPISAKTNRQFKEQAYWSDHSFDAQIPLSGSSSLPQPTFISAHASSISHSHHHFGCPIHDSIIVMGGTYTARRTRSCLSFPRSEERRVGKEC